MQILISFLLTITSASNYFQENMKPLPCLLLVLFLWGCTVASAQELYTARGYWNELNKDVYKKISDKKLKGETLTAQETGYLEDYEQYLANYYLRMSDDEKRIFENMKEQWAREIKPEPAPPADDFELRPRHRVANGFYGLYYGSSLVAVANLEDEAAVGIPLIMAGLWQLGPVINQKKYNGINSSVIRASNIGKGMGMLYGFTLGWGIGGDPLDGKLSLGLSTVGSIALGEIAFQSQKKNNFSDGHIEMMGFYGGFLGPVVTGLGVGALNPEDASVIGLSLTGGCIAGLVIGNQESKKYAYSSGDVDAIQSLSLIMGGVGLAAAIESIDSDRLGVLLIPAATAVSGAIWSQRSVRGVHLTKKQGGGVTLASGGGALVGLGLMIMIGSDSPGVSIGVPSAFALIAHQLAFHSYKRKNREQSPKLGQSKHKGEFSLQVMPENYFNNKHASEKIFQTTGSLASPVVKLKFRF
jgi:hypothetical protein